MEMCVSKLGFVRNTSANHTLMETTQRALARQNNQPERLNAEHVDYSMKSQCLFFHNCNTEVSFRKYISRKFQLT